MTLLEFIKSLTKVELDDFAKRCETTTGQLKQVARGHRRCGESLAINIERESKRVVTCEKLRDDVDWAYLRETKADPDINTEAGEAAA